MRGRQLLCGYDAAARSGDARQPHNHGTLPGYTRRRRPVSLVYANWFDTTTDAIACERQVKGWSRVKKEALIQGDFNALPGLSKRGPK